MLGLEVYSRNLSPMDYLFLINLVCVYVHYKKGYTQYKVLEKYKYNMDSLIAIWGRIQMNESSLRVYKLQIKNDKSRICEKKN